MATAVSTSQIQITFTQKNEDVQNGLYKSLGRVRFPNQDLLGHVEGPAGKAWGLSRCRKTRSFTADFYP